MYENAVYEGIPALLAELKAFGVRLFVATSKPRVYSTEIIRHFGLERYFDKVYGSELDGTHNEKADLIRHLVSAENLCKDDTYMIGDTVYDVDGAHRNGIRAIAVRYGYGKTQDLSKAEHLASTVDDLRTIAAHIVSKWRSREDPSAGKGVVLG